ncbi:MAG: hypothetical protein KKE39_11330 [Bacteroidetes bacterium]|nr:hypothetical protein [Bacteroidota bacterium]MBU1373180.1 hypothetical protein [Bacteroidota bacterium]MBU1486252.1 hypothetical protein [Bacteroidota bacterium]MBU1761311.1 hypothetical protein [Bacteroidota bacterium]MBU2047077.1 hypothetical protein [Bacteroidota bacterium]
MSTAELKNQIIEKLEHINDETILNDIYKLIQLESEIATVYQLSNDENEAVEMAFQDIDAGKTYSSTEANSTMKSRLIYL